MATTSQAVRAVWSGAPPRDTRRRGAAPAPRASRAPRRPFTKQNPALHACYCGHVVPRAEWPQFESSLASPLPTTFCFVHTGGAEVDPARVQARLDALLAAIRLNPPGEGAPCVARGARVCLSLHAARRGGVHATLRVEAAAAPRHVRRLRFLGDCAAWQLDSPRGELKALRCTLRPLRRFVEAHARLGRLNRQEAVSMLPPLLLGVERGHVVVDLCAAPGSKTVLLLSRLAAPPAPRGGACGAVVANDINPARCHRLRVRLARSRAPATVVTCHAAQHFPAAEGAADRVLCDVPCSGDGTLRKNPDGWERWQPRYPATLHPLQLAILTRGLQLLKEGGLLLYSTCSFSPVENEAVVASALRHCDGVTLVDTTSALPDLITSEGLSTWRVNVGAAGDGISSWADASAEDAAAWRLSPSLFPPSHEECARFHLHRCRRLLPHAQDTGGFFVALLRKEAGATIRIDPARGAPPPPPPPPSELAELDHLAGLALDDDDDDDVPAAPREPAPYSFFSFTAVDAASDEMRTLRAFYSLADDFPWPQLFSSFAHTVSRRLYFTSAAAAAALRCDGLRVLYAGVKAFERDASLGVGCAYRVVQEGALLLLPFLGARTLALSPLALAALLRVPSLALPLPTPYPTPELAAETIDAEDGALLSPLVEWLAALQPNGCCVLSCERRDGTARMAVSAMKYTDKAVLFITQGERTTMLDDLACYYNDDDDLPELS
ncbi:hypothetical protein AB1Y20_017836 [Prymnesium parvum]|uniref:SAM-dependent MTase RsmB/NOP-type domain-containing protein n=1 Tax=Prymnesium parvum TaxID=97485 RepID=A0AB34JQG6_PRYPA